jgi:hypothetical protein
MSFAKQSQMLSMDGLDVDSREPILDDNMLFDDSTGSDSLEDILVDLKDDGADLILTLDPVPGGLDQDDIVEESELEVEEPEEVEVNDDPWAIPGKLSNFLNWLSDRMQSCPTHSGRDSAGLERAIAYFERLDSCISRAVRMDFNNEISIESLEQARDEIHRGLERLQDRLEKVKSSKYPKKGRKKKSDEETDGLVKEATKATRIDGIVISVPLFISRLARVCINGMVSAGHDIEDMFMKLSKKYDLTKREQAELMQLLEDMNYPMRRDRGFDVDEEINTSSTDNYDWNGNYPG